MKKGNYRKRIITYVKEFFNTFINKNYKKVTKNNAHKSHSWYYLVI